MIFLGLFMAMDIVTLIVAYLEQGVIVEVPIITPILVPFAYLKTAFS